MAENIIINNSQPSTNSNQNESGPLENIFANILRILLVLIILGTIIAIYVLVENYEAIAVFFTTGFIGWLNPFDSPEGDTGPLESLVGTNSKSAGSFIPGPIGWFFKLTP